MNPIIDLMIIGIIVTMVLVNMNSLRKSKETTSYWTKLGEKVNAFNLLEHSPALSFTNSVHNSRD